MPIYTIVILTNFEIAYHCVVEGKGTESKKLKAFAGLKIKISKSKMAGQPSISQSDFLVGGGDRAQIMWRPDLVP